jgi:hypothetical protein
MNRGIDIFEKKLSTKNTKSTKITARNLLLLMSTLPRRSGREKGNNMAVGRRVGTAYQKLLVGSAHPQSTT